jgi:hypothetical protein
VELDALLAGRPAAVQETERRLVASARELIPDPVETCDGGDYGIGVGPGYKGSCSSSRRRLRACGWGSPAAAALSSRDFGPPTRQSRRICTLTVTMTVNVQMVRRGSSRPPVNASRSRQRRRHAAAG